ncbi:MAG: PaaI family thioesterase [Alphaproteobacteria bacterium]|nr:PaaI family thioesterase [Alphaproteobacteria bacterium]MDX5416172.1 PaaI family thioesterase [Alphaproteobacteria bacterium]MDX5493478.1 PaaI family thioesterase [Alphaproteobacteria bacterium]
MTDTEHDNPPDGYVPSTSRGPYTTHNGPFYHKVTEEGFWHGVRVKKRHCNSRGITHGGMLMAFADGLLGTAVWRETQMVALTVRMNSDFLSSARPGDWLEGTARVTRATKSVAFCEAELFVGNRPVLKASGVFKIMARHKAPD